MGVERGGDYCKFDFPLHLESSHHLLFAYFCNINTPNHVKGRQDMRRLWSQMTAWSKERKKASPHDGQTPLVRFAKAREKQAITQLYRY
ncbi:dedicator of cytokinesis protein 11-like protein [Corchorus olitorius]|uniref:Dedicator of cytokinesis protein 11-like protein n=1 Tax=Corchorus olitorius TaxID=93759 RepID=A0A1R3JB76_9ROSI|nr:dedicator of cytokinesis protein 11-like protein [Corchorus olitorius]